jgi:uncharacterized protein with WD repeat
MMSYLSTLTLLLGCFCNAGDAQAATPKERRLLNDTANVSRVVCSPDGQFLALAGLDRIVVWDLKMGARAAVLDGHKGPVSAPAFSPDGRLLATGSAEDSLVVLWDTQTWKRLDTIKGKLVPTAIAFSPDGKFLGGGGAFTSWVWDLTAKRCVRLIDDHKLRVNAVAWSPDGRSLATAHGRFYKPPLKHPAEVMVWDVGTGRRTFYSSVQKEEVTSVTFSPDGRFLAAGAVDGTVRIWDVQTGEERYLFGKDLFAAFFFSRDGSQLLTGCQGGLRLYDLRTSRPVWSIDGEVISIWSVALIPNSSLLATAQLGVGVRIWELPDKPHDR